MFFPVPKKKEVDRIVMARQRANGEELSLEGSAQDVPAGPDMVEFIAEKGSRVRLISEDLQSYFPSVDASTARALINSIDMPFVAGDFKGTKAFKKAKLGAVLGIANGRWCRPGPCQ